MTSKSVGTRSWRGGFALAAALCALGCASERDETKRGTASSASPATAQPASSGATPPSPAADADAAPGSAIHAAVDPARPAPAKSACQEQSAQEFLLRKGQIAKIGASKSEREAIEAARQKSLEYRTRQYGHVSGFGRKSDNAHPPSFYAKRTTFMDRPLVVHEKIVPALACVEAAIRRECASVPYQPRQVTGMRFANTFKDYEVSNHLYGIAVDIDSHLNPCCNCVGKWSESPLCDKKVSSPFERMAMPRCWVDVFELYGFYWLGHDELEDTMHFEFLGDPERIRE